MCLFAARFPKAAKREVIENCLVVRKGNKYTVYVWAYLHYLRLFFAGKKPDVLVEVINTLPFFSPLYPRCRKMALIHQLTQESWYYKKYNHFLCRMGYCLEKAALRLYRKMPVITISNSTRHGLQQAGIRHVRVVPIGIDHAAYSPADKNTDRLRIIYIGGLRIQKRVDHILEAFSLIQQRVPDSELWIVGSGDQLEPLRQKAAVLGVQGQVTFFGHANDWEKQDLLEKANLMLMASVKEGWGMVVTEANAYGIPVISYNVDGLRDSVTDGVNGVLTQSNNPRSLSAESADLFLDKERFRWLIASSFTDAGKYSWEKSAKLFGEVIRSGIV